MHLHWYQILALAFFAMVTVNLTSSIANVYINNATTGASLFWAWFFSAVMFLSAFFLQC